MNWPICIFEDSRLDTFLPLVHTRPVFELLCGCFTFVERIALLHPESQINLVVRDFLKPLCQNRYELSFINSIEFTQKTLFVNGRTFYSKALKAKALAAPENLIVFSGNDVAMIVADGAFLQEVLPFLRQRTLSKETLLVIARKHNNIEVIEENGCVSTSIWKLIERNGEQILSDLEFIDSLGVILSPLNHLIAISHEENVSIGKHCTISPFVHLDASKGPIIISNNVYIKSHVLIEGPVFIGSQTIIQPGFIRNNSSIGSHCRIGGEVEGSVFMPFSNKYHAGFIGHSYIGSWVNLGAMTTTSDLKNNYKSVTLSIDHSDIETGMQFLGSIIGDHTKLSIGSLLATGTIIGLGCNLAKPESFLPKSISNFTWLTGAETTTYELKRFIQTAEKVYARRQQVLDMHEQRLLEYLHEKTATN